MREIVKRLQENRLSRILESEGKRRLKRRFNESESSKFGPEEYRGYRITHTSDDKDYLVYAPGSIDPIPCESYSAAIQYIDSELDEE